MAQYVRLLVTRLRPDLEGTYALALAEMEGLSGERNLARGLYELRLNGRRVGDHLLAPEWTDYRRRVQYQTYDVTELLQEGANAIGVLLGDGWYAGRLGMTHAYGSMRLRAVYGRKPRFLLQLQVELADGRELILVSDGAWRSTTEGPIRRADLYDGEIYDARNELPGWDRPGFDDADWQAVEVDEDVAVSRVAQRYEPLRVTHQLPACSVSEPQPGVYIFDLGQEIAGWPPASRPPP